jgi:hypothetical protein
MNDNFDVFVKEHLDDVLCDIQKNQALAQLKVRQAKQHKWFHIKLSLVKVFRKTNVPAYVTTEVELQDCAVSPSFSYNQL